MTSKFFIPLLLLLTLFVVQVFAQKAAPTPTPQAVSEQGVSIEFRVTPIGRKVKNDSGLMAGEDATASFKITGTNGSVPLSNLRPAVWIDQRPGKDPSDMNQCRDKIQAFLQSSFSKRPVLDLNSYFVLTLNCAVAYISIFQLAHKVTERVEDLKKVIEVKYTGLPFPWARNYLERIQRSIPVLAVNVGGFHEAERESVPIFLDFVVKQTVNLLLAF